MNFIERYRMESGLVRRIRNMLATGALSVPRQTLNTYLSKIEYHTERRLEHTMPQVDNTTLPMGGAAMRIATVSLLAMSVHAERQNYNRARQTYRIHITNNVSMPGMPEKYVVTGRMAKKIYTALSRAYYMNQAQK